MLLICYNPWKRTLPGTNPSSDHQAKEVDAKMAEVGKGRHPKKFNYTYNDLAELFGMTVGAVRKAVHDGRLDPENLSSIYEFLNKRMADPSSPLDKEELPEDQDEGVEEYAERYRKAQGLAPGEKVQNTPAEPGRTIDQYAGGKLPAGVLCPACGELMAETFGLQHYHCGPCNRSWGGTVTRMQDIAREVWRKKHGG